QRPVTRAGTAFEPHSDPLVELTRSVAGFAAECAFGFASWSTFAAVLASERGEDNDCRDALRAAARYFMNGDSITCSSGIVANAGAFLCEAEGPRHARELVELFWPRVVKCATDGRSAIDAVAHELLARLSCTKAPADLPDGREVLRATLPDRESASAVIEAIKMH
ncbi:MAG TPA: hypothetical protein VH054_16780, partial [Polyangiaceae bacterium]|nr:hypothetical protein [Polyangiaceae bacterium]